VRIPTSGISTSAFFVAAELSRNATKRGVTVLNTHDPTIPDQIAKLVSDFQTESTGHTPKAVSVVLTDDALVITLHKALSAAEQVLARTAEGSAQVQEYHRQLFASSSKSLREEIQRITGRRVREATAEVEPTTGAIVHAFTTGTLVQVYLLANGHLSELIKKD
jgi:uncharacterized protein YbcI